MSGNPFSKPASADGFTWEDHKGRLLLVEPKGFETGITTTYGLKDAVRGDVTVIDAPGGAEVYPDALLFPKAIISQTRGLIGEMVLGRLTQGSAKPGQKPPWLIQEPTEDEITAGLTYVEKRKANSPFATPAVAESKPPF